MRYQISLQAGQLSLETRQEKWPLDDLLTFASRQNPRRGFLFVSRVLGKHIPCRPSRMRAVYRDLAQHLQHIPGPVLVIGMAETATGLGAGVADSLTTIHNESILYLATTRHPLAAPLLLDFDESHSHAPDHLLYQPQDMALLRRTRSLVLVDDEISTGRTLKVLTQGMMQHLPALEAICPTSIVNWLTPEAESNWMVGLGPSVHFHALLSGTFHFEADPGFKPRLPEAMQAQYAVPFARSDTGRRGIVMGEPLPRLHGECPAGPLAVIGTGEFSYQPFLLAENLEEQGRDVVFQSTTRSPILPGPAISRIHHFGDERGEGINNFIYNLPPDRQLLVAYEEASFAHHHGLAAQETVWPWSLPLETP